MTNGELFEKAYGYSIDGLPKGMEARKEWANKTFISPIEKGNANWNPFGPEQQTDGWIDERISKLTTYINVCVWVQDYKLAAKTAFEIAKLQELKEELNSL